MFTLLVEFVLKMFNMFLSHHRMRNLYFQNETDVSANNNNNASDLMRLIGQISLKILLQQRFFHHVCLSNAGISVSNMEFLPGDALYVSNAFVV